MEIRIGTFRGIRDGKRGYGAMAFGTKGVQPGGDYEGYKPVVEEIARKFDAERRSQSP